MFYRDRIISYNNHRNVHERAINKKHKDKTGERH